MPIKPKEITSEVLEKAKRLLEYNPETGILSWKPHNESRGKGRPKAGGPVRSVNHYGYLRVMIDGVSYRAHRLAWSMYHNEPIPQDKILDHINGITSDNRIGNLRLTTQGVNMQNIRSAMKTSKSGLIGASWCSVMRKWRACIRIQGRQTVLSYHDTPKPPTKPT